MLREQQALQIRLGAAEQAAAAIRAQVLVTQGWGALRDWLEAPEAHLGERPPQPTQAAGCDPAAKGETAVRRKPDRLADLFDAA